LLSELQVLKGLTRLEAVNETGYYLASDHADLRISSCGRASDRVLSRVGSHYTCCGHTDTPGQPHSLCFNHTCADHPSSAYPPGVLAWLLKNGLQTPEVGHLSSIFPCISISGFTVLRGPSSSVFHDYSPRLCVDFS
jgi:hypothetical protein